MRNSTFERIAVGDLVQVVRSACCEKNLTNARVLGIPFKVHALGNAFWECPHCDASGTDAMAYPEGTIGNRGADQAPLRTLRRIPPLSELEGTKTDEPLKEPA